MTRKAKVKNPIIYGVFGDTPRTDADNIESLWFDENKAKDRIEWLNKNDECNTYHMEKIEMSDNLKDVGIPEKKSTNEIWNKICDKMLELDIPYVELKKDVHSKGNRYIWEGTNKEMGDDYFYFEVSPIEEKSVGQEGYGVIFCVAGEYSSSKCYKTYEEFEEKMDETLQFLKDNDFEITHTIER